MPLLRHGRVADHNPWLHLPDAEPLPEDTDSVEDGSVSLVVSLQRFLGLHSHSTATVSGVFLEPADDAGTLAEHLHRIQLITIRFTEPADTRGYAQARLLREKLHYSGELRAGGDVRPDQIPFLTRAGFDAFELLEAPDKSQLRQILSRLELGYQPNYELPVAG